MILRSVMKHVKDQNWFAVGLDFLIVVVGVFIGIQVANWNTERADRKSEQEAVIRLHGELVDNTAYLEERLESYTAHVANLNSYYKHLFDQSSPAPEVEDLNGTLCRNGVASYGANPTGVYDELVASGRLGLITDDDTRKALSEFHAELNAGTAFFAELGFLRRDAYTQIAPYREWIAPDNPLDRINCTIDYAALAAAPIGKSIVGDILRAERGLIVAFTSRRDKAKETIDILTRAYPGSN